MTILRRAETLIVGGINVPTPTFFPAISSVKSNVQPLDDLMVLRAIKYPQFLISAHDVHYAKPIQRKRIDSLLRDAVRGGQIVLLDSGNYEAFWREREKWWSARRFARILRSTSSHLAFAFDELRPRGSSRTVAKQVESAVLRDHRSARQATVVPVVHGTLNLLPGTIAEVTRRLTPILVGVPERELGEGLYHRAAVIARIRARLDRLGHYCCLHLLGTGNPLSILVYAMAGADSFDGLEWCRTTVDYETSRLHHLSQWDLFSRQSGLRLRKLPYRAGALIHNLRFYSQWMDRIRWAIRAHQEVELLEKYLPTDAIRKIRPLVRRSGK
jgi:queuine/archaeosine tRNA-ribosyltransferase